MREQRTLRERQAATDVEADRLDSQDAQSPGPMLVQTTTVGTYPTVAGSYFAVVAVDPGGTASEGSAGTFAAETETFFALNTGGAVPPSGTKLIAVPDNGRWVFNYNG